MNALHERVSTNEGAPRRIWSVGQFAERFPAWSPASLRALIYTSEDRISHGGDVIKGNGLRKSGAIIRVGRRVLIDEEAFFRWIAEQNRNRKTAP